jgi:DNA-binding transcriptional regulator PaaX
MGRQYYKSMITKYGQSIVDELEALEFVTKKWELEELQERYEYFMAKIQELRP